MNKIEELKILIEEYEILLIELDEMVDIWNSDSDDAALNDPSDQYLKEEEIEDKYNEIKEFITEL